MMPKFTSKKNKQKKNKQQQFFSLTVSKPVENIFNAHFSHVLINIWLP